MSIKSDDETLIKNLFKECFQTHKQKKNYTQEQVDEHSGVSKAVTGRVENSNSLINMHTLAQYICSLDIDANNFFAEYKAKSKFFNQE